MRADFSGLGERERLGGLTRLHNIGKYILVSLLLWIMLVAALETFSPSCVSALASSVTAIAVDPYTYVADPGDQISVNISVANAEDLFSYQVQLGFDWHILEAVGATEGAFLKEGTESPMGTFFSYQIRHEVEGTYIIVVCVTLGQYPGVSGSGTLFSVNFMVKHSGISNLHLYDSMLLDSTASEIPHITLDGVFHTNVPRAQFTFTKTYPTTGEDVTFNASGSYDYEGTIVSYEWDFGDTATGIGMITTHAYAVEGSYAVILTVTDNEGLSDSVAAPIYPRAPLLAYIPVPYHRQANSYYCGPAALEMLFDFCGPDVSQHEIADAARTAPDGTYTCDMLRASHFSNLSTSVGRVPGSVTGYTNRGLGYAAFEYWGMTIDQLKSLIAAGYPIVILTTWHFRVAVGYSNTRIVFQDSYYGENLTLTYQELDSTWDYSGHWGLFVSPWEVEVFAPREVLLGSSFNVTARITYPLPIPFMGEQYLASMSNATAVFPTGLNLVVGETAKKQINTGDIPPGASANVTWTLRADSVGSHVVAFEAEGKVSGFVPPLPSYPDSYSYEDRIGGVGQSVIDVVLPPDPIEQVQELIETIKSWNLPKGIEKRLSSQLTGALHLLDVSNTDGAVRRLEHFVNGVEALRGNRLTDEQADCLISEAQRMIDLIHE